MNGKNNSDTRMVSATSKKILAVVDKWAAQTRKSWSNVSIDNEDPLSGLVIMGDTIREAILEDVPESERQYYDFSTRVVGFSNKPCEGIVTLLFDGLSWDFLSYESDFHLYRVKLENMLKKKGYYMENLSACAISIQEA